MRPVMRATKVIAFGTVGATATGDLAGFEKSEAGELLRVLRNMGYTLVEPTSREATHFVSLDHHVESLTAVAERVPIERRILLVLEPRVVKPGNYRPETTSHYGAVLSYTRAAVASRVLPWPQRDWRARPPATTIQRESGTTALINANKLSFIGGSLYGLRRRVIRAFSHEGLPLTLAGPNWERRGLTALYENAKSIAYATLNHERVVLSEWAVPLRLGPSITHLGPVKDKEAVLLGCEFAVVIENSADYVSEKLFDAVIAGCIPLYVGPPLRDYNIPDDVAVVLPQDPQAFTRAVRELSVEKKTAVLEAGRSWLRDDRTHDTWAMPHALRGTAEAIDEQFRRTEQPV